MRARQELLAHCRRATCANSETSLAGFRGKSSNSASRIDGQLPQLLARLKPPNGIAQIDAGADVVGNYRDALADDGFLVALCHIDLPVLFAELRDFGLGVLDDVTKAGIGVRCT